MDWHISGPKTIGGQSYNILYGFAVLFRCKVKIVDIMFIKESEFSLFTNSYIVFLSWSPGFYSIAIKHLKQTGLYYTLKPAFCDVQYS